MKRHFNKNIFALLFVTVPALLWLVANLARPYVIDPKCSHSPNTCTSESVIPIDQLSLGMEDWKADLYSYRAQNFSGILAFAAPTLWNGFSYALGYLNAPAALVSLGADLLVIAQTIAWNGFFTEASHLVSQRPRPFVYSDPEVRGIDPAHYTSFYSGHTSFTAATLFAVFLILRRKKAPKWTLLLSAATFEGFVIATAYFRILAGRHFLTDVLCGALAGTLIAWSVGALNGYFNQNFRIFNNPKHYP